MNGMSMKPTRPSFRHLALVAGVGFFLFAATGCVSYRTHVKVEPNGELHIVERVEIQPGVVDSMGLDPKLAWTAFESTTLSRGGTFAKDRPDSLKGATAEYPLDNWTELGQRGQAFKGIDEIERRTRPANVQSELKDQYFWTVTTLKYELEISEPSGAQVDSAWAPWLTQATGTLEVEVPGTIEATNAPTRSGNLLSYPLAYGQTVEVEVTYRQMQWVAVVSVILVAIFLGYLALAGLKAMQARKKPPARPKTA
jgi:hypothetical protein